MINPSIIAQKIKEAKSQHQQRIELLCQVVDEFCPVAEPETEPRPGRSETFSDNLILKLEMIGRLSGIKGETELLRHMARHYQWLFPELPTQSWLWRRLRSLMPQVETFRQTLNVKLGFYNVEGLNLTNIQY